MIEQIKILLKNKEYEKIISLLESYNNEDIISSNLLVKKGISYLLKENGDSNDLVKAKKSFQKALIIDEEFIPAIIELAWYYYSIENKTNKSQILFKKALNLSISNLKESLDGLLKSTDELSSKKEALETSKRMLNKIKKEIRNIEKNF